VSDRLFELLDELVPGDAPDGDWHAVLEAAGITPRRKVPGRWVLAVCALIAVSTVVAVTPAFGLHDLLLDLVGARTPVAFDRTEPAPPEIKRFFLEIGQHAPPGMDPGVLPDEARKITFRGAGGQKRVLWIAPTRTGGFCSMLVGAGGGCVTKSTERRQGALGEVGGSYSTARGLQPRIVEIDGHVYSPAVATLTLEFQDGSSLPLPFVYVSSPIEAGFFIAGIPPDHQRQGEWPTKVVARNGAGAILATRTIQEPNRSRPPIRPPRVFKPQPAAVLPLASTVTPSAPLQRGTGEGVSVVAGANGAVRLTARGIPHRIAKLLAGRVFIDCFRLTREFGLFTVLSDGVDGAFAGSIGFTLRNVGRPLDGCEIDGGAGHRWPDSLGSHSPVEIALTARGGAYFANRATARDLALFVRSGRIQRLRKGPAVEARAAIEAAYSRDLAHSPIRIAVLGPATLRFTEISPTGKQFRVIVRNGRIERENLRPYASVH
jgi:hypothetical protein